MTPMSLKTGTNTLTLEGPQTRQASKQGQELIIATLNLQYFSSYPQDIEVARKRLREVFQEGPAPPDIICVQEGLFSKDVLGDVGFQKVVCSAAEGHAQSVYDMVYGHEQTLKICPPCYHQELLCNQIYLRRGSEWHVVGHGSLPITSDIILKGGGGRLQGKLAIRSMVWVKIRKAINGPFAYVMCTHITGGRFEDQYFMQQLAEERKLQLNRIVKFYENRPEPSNDDVGIIVGDFNATTVYLPDGPMNGYFKMSIESSPGVQADGKWYWNSSGTEMGLEEHFKKYMISPFVAINKHRWTFAYDHYHVGYTSGFGHTIDHMAMSRPLQVRSSEKICLTNQKFGGKAAETDVPLTDHNAVKVAFVVSKAKEAHTSVFRTEFDFLSFLKGFRAVVYISGFGSKQQFADLDAVVGEVAKPLFGDEDSLDMHFGKGKWVACFGGDPLRMDAPDIAALVERLQKRHNLVVVAVQADQVERDGGVEDHIDGAYFYPTEYLDESKKQVAWGGVVNGEVVGTTKIMVNVIPLSGLPLFWLCAGGGDIAMEEIRHVFERGHAIMSIRAKARFPQDPNLPFGPCPAFWNSMETFDTIGEGEYVWRRRKRGDAKVESCT